MENEESLNKKVKKEERVISNFMMEISNDEEWINLFSWFFFFIIFLICFWKFKDFFYKFLVLCLVNAHLFMLSKPTLDGFESVICTQSLVTKLKFVFFIFLLIFIILLSIFKSFIWFFCNFLYFYINIKI